MEKKKEKQYGEYDCQICKTITKGRYKTLAHTFWGCTRQLKERKRGQRDREKERKQKNLLDKWREDLTYKKREKTWQPIHIFGMFWNANGIKKRLSKFATQKII